MKRQVKHDVKRTVEHNVKQCETWIENINTGPYAQLTGFGISNLKLLNVFYFERVLSAIALSSQLSALEPAEVSSKCILKNVQKKRKKTKSRKRRNNLINQDFCSFVL